MVARTRWTLRIDHLPTRLAIGAGARPRPLAIEVSLTIQALVEVLPQTGADRIDLDAICGWITGAWAQSPPTLLLEARAAELMDHVFGFDRRIQELGVSLVRPVDGIAGPGRLVVEREATRGQFEAQQRMAPATRTAARTGANGGGRGSAPRPPTPERT